MSLVTNQVYSNSLVSIILLKKCISSECLIVVLCCFPIIIANVAYKTILFLKQTKYLIFCVWVYTPVKKKSLKLTDLIKVFKILHRVETSDVYKNKKSN